MDSPQGPPSRRFEWIGAGLLFGLAMSCTVHQAAIRSDRSGFDIFLNWTRAYVITSVVLLLCWGSLRRLIPHLAFIAIAPLVAFTTVAVAMGGWRWYHNEFIRPSDRDMANELVQSQDEFDSGVQHLQAMLDQVPESPFDTSSPGGFATVVLPPGNDLTRLGVKRAIARPDRQWLWLVTWTPSERAPPYLKGYLYHSNGTSISLEDATNEAGSHVVAVTEIGKGWYVFTARDFFE